jgi:HAD superfamily hydrolase (TIGR01549 family)
MRRIRRGPRIDFGASYVRPRVLSSRERVLIGTPELCPRSLRASARSVLTFPLEMGSVLGHETSTVCCDDTQGGRAMEQRQAFLFDLDGTLVDSVYQHVLAWQDALDRTGIEVSVWRIHRKIGMSGGLFANALLRETGRAVTTQEANRLRQLHRDAYATRSANVKPLPGARALLAYLTEVRVPWAIATSGYLESAGPTLELLQVPDGVPVVTRDQVAHAKPDPDLFLAAAERLGIDITHSVVVGDSVWDLLASQRARSLGIGLLSGGYGQDELERAGAYRVYEDPADLLRHLDEVGVRVEENGSR